METIKTRRTLAVAAVVVAGSQIGQAWTSRAQTPATRFFTIAAVEPRGGASVGQEAFPTQALPPGGGYVIRQPDQTGRWEVSAYLWMPSQIVVNQGDEVTLDFVGINGAAHPTEIQGVGENVHVAARARHARLVQGRQARGLSRDLQHARAIDARRDRRCGEAVSDQRSGLSRPSVGAAGTHASGRR